ncbi:MAG: hypothetical protein EBR91_11455, partial [Flavobacteriia bacterium]|nr:hypothetical protein [Flavobacteriia bacterium]
MPLTLDMKLSFSIFLFLFSLGIIAQPQKINYQFSLQDSLGKTLKNTSITIKLSIVDSFQQGRILFEETHVCTTNNQGLASIQMGSGAPTFSNFSAIPWALPNSKYLKSSFSLDGGISFFNLGIQELVSVPYALSTGSLMEGTRISSSIGEQYELIIDSSGPVWRKIIPAKTCPNSVQYGSMVYPIVKLGQQCWMARNLNIGTLKNSISTVDSQRNNGNMEKYCWNNSTLSCDTFGGFYQWAEAMNYTSGAMNNGLWSNKPSGHIQGICPSGWHIPSYSEFDTLIQFFGGSTTAGGLMKGIDFWNSPNTG